MDLFDDDDDDWDDFYNEGGNVIVIGGGATLIYDIVIGAISTFATLASLLAVSTERLARHLPLPIVYLMYAVCLRLLLGIATLGSMSFITLLISLSLLGPLQLANGFRLGGGWLRSFTHRQRGTGTNTVSQWLMIVIVLIGAANTLFSVYRLVEKLAHRALVYLETQILEVNSEEVRKSQARPTWIGMWWRQGRWRTLGGWWELIMRAWVDARGRWERWRAERMVQQHVE